MGFKNNKNIKNNKNYRPNMLVDNFDHEQAERVVILNKPRVKLNRPSK